MRSLSEPSRNIDLHHVLTRVIPGSTRSTVAVGCLLAISACEIPMPAHAQLDQAAIVDATRKLFLGMPKVDALLKRDPEVRQRFETWLTRMAREQLAALNGPKGNNDQLRAELLKRRQKDQHVRRQGAPAEWEKVDRENRTWLANVIDKHGWPSASMVGSDGAHAAWLLAQHATADPEFQKRCLRLMRNAAKGEVAPADIAYLVDRIRHRAGKPQLYGTQLEPIDGRMTLAKVDEPDQLNRRRAELGLMPIEVYLLFAEANPSSLKGRARGASATLEKESGAGWP